MAVTDNTSLPQLDTSDSGNDVRRLVAGLLVAHVVLIAGLPLLTGRWLDVAVGRFPDASSVFWLLGVPAALSMLTMVIALSVSGRSSWRAAFRWPTSHDGMSNRTAVVASVVTLVALAGGVRGIGDAGLGLSAVLLLTILLLLLLVILLLLILLLLLLLLLPLLLLLSLSLLLSLLVVALLLWMLLLPLVLYQ